MMLMIIRYSTTITILYIKSTVALAMLISFKAMGNIVLYAETKL